MTRVALALLALLSLGCASAYDATYEDEYGRLERDQAERDAAEEAAHAEARRYAAVVYFEVGRNDLSGAAHRELRWFAEKLEPYPRALIRVQGFADATGSEPRNEVLSLERAQRVADYLQLLGFDAARVRTEGFSTSFPAETNESAAGRRRNRRVEVTVR